MPRPPDENGHLVRAIAFDRLAVGERPSRVEEVFAMVAEHDHDRVLAQAVAIQLRQQRTDRAIDPRDRAVVQTLDVRRLGGTRSGEIPRRPAANLLHEIPRGDAVAIRTVVRSGPKRLRGHRHVGLVRIVEED